MVSEDSDQFGSGFSTVHRLDDFYNLSETLPAEMIASAHSFDTVGEFLEVKSFG